MIKRFPKGFGMKIIFRIFRSVEKYFQIIFFLDTEKVILARSVQLSTKRVVLNPKPERRKEPKSTSFTRRGGLT